ncbi:MAG: DUF2953 domain-containing protein [Fidelibacterota bacterium]
MTIVFWVILFSTGLAMLLVHTVRIQFQGSYTDLPAKRSWKGQVQIGWSHWGIQIRSQEGYLIQIGPYHHPWFSFKRPKKVRLSRKGPKSFKRIRIPAREWIALAHKTLRFQSLTLTGELGFSNPMTTGISFGILSALKHGVMPDTLQIQVEPRFGKLPHTQLEAGLRFHFRPAIVLWYGGRTLIKFRR